MRMWERAQRLGHLSLLCTPWGLIGDLLHGSPGAGDPARTQSMAHLHPQGGHKATVSEVNLCLAFHTFHLAKKETRPEILVPGEPVTGMQMLDPTHFRQFVVLIIHDQDVILQFLDLGLGRDLFKL